MVNNSSNIHKGHRQRQLKIVSETQFKGMNEIQVLEYILSLIIPRIDTNPIAHRLLNQFNNLAGVLDADYNLTKDIDGIGITTAKKLASFKYIANLYRESKYSSRVSIKTFGDLCNFCYGKLSHQENESFFAFAIANDYKLLGGMEFAGKPHSVDVPKKELTKFLVSVNAGKMFLTHNHPNDNLLPSNNDIASTEEIKNLCQTLGIDFIDHIIVGISTVYSINNNNSYNIENMK